MVHQISSSDAYINVKTNGNHIAIDVVVFTHQDVHDVTLLVRLGVPYCSINSKDLQY